MEKADRIGIRAWLAVLITLLGGGTVLLAWAYYHDQITATRDEQETALSAIADLKVEAIVAWRRERLGNAAAIAGDRGLAELARRYFAARQNASLAAVLRQQLGVRRSSNGYMTAVLFDAAGVPALAADAGQPRLDAETCRLALQVARDRSVVLRDLHRDTAGGPIHLGLFAPLLGAGGDPPGVVALGIDPMRFLYPHIRQWPTPSASGETLLVRREGDEVVYLNEVRHRPPGSALELRLPVNASEFAAARAALGFQGVMIGRDYRGVEVLAAVRRVPDSPWTLLAKIDAAEAYAPVRGRVVRLVLLAGLLTTTCVFIMLFLWHRRRSEYYRRLYQAQAERGKSEASLARAQAIAALGSWEAEFTVEGADLKPLAYRWSDEVYRIFGVRKNEFSPSREAFYERVHPDDRSIVLAAAQQALGTGKAYEVEHRIVRPDGAVRYVREQAEIMRGATHVLMAGTVQDITEYKHLEQQFRQAQKLESIGRLAGGVAHDFNNLLTIINGYTDMVLAGQAETDPHHEPLLQVREAGERAAALTRQLLAFSRKQVLDPRVIDVNQLITDLDKMLQRLLGETIELITEPSHDPEPVLADPGQLQQVIMNLAINARDAMPRGGKLVIETSHVQLDAGYTAAHPEVKPGAYVIVSVSDTGLGMDEATKSHIFEPFFTTKPVGAGTGLGLATVYGIVRQSGGWIWVYSEPGRGTTFKLYLPRTEPTAEAIGARPLEPPRGDETVLIVEDERDVRTLAATILRNLGYSVIEACDAQHALELCCLGASGIDLLLTDVVMPGMSGYELAARARAAFPALKVVFVSGYSESVAERRPEDSVYISKPFTPVSLAVNVRNALDARRRTSPE